MTGIEPRTSGIGSDRHWANWATTTATSHNFWPQFKYLSMTFVQWTGARFYAGYMNFWPQFKSFSMIFVQWTTMPAKWTFDHNRSCSAPTSQSRAPRPRSSRPASIFRIFWWVHFRVGSVHRWQVFKNGPSPTSSSFIFVFSIKHNNFYKK